MATEAHAVRRAAGGHLIRGVVKARANEVGLLAAAIALFVVMTYIAPNFSTTDNLLNILRDSAFVGIIAWGMTLVIVGGEIDISVGAAAAFASVLLAKLNSSVGVPLVPAILVTLVVGTGFGLFAGYLRAEFEVPSFITTLALFISLRGAAQVMSDAVPVPIPNQSFQNLGAGSVLGFPVPAIIMLVLFAVFSFVARRTVFGRQVYAIGGNADAARLSGTPVVRVRTILMGITGLLAALTGVLIASRLGSGNSGAANGTEFDVIAAVVVGGTALSGGRGSMVGTLLGVLFIAMLVNGLVLLGVNPFTQDVVRGGVVLLAVLVNVLVVRRQRSRTVKEGS